MKPRTIAVCACAAVAASLLAPAAQAGSSLRSFIGGGRPFLRISPSDERIESIGHCGDTYVVKTADGSVRKYWEFNVRFKTDSSAHGPVAGTPILLEAGMQGDRVYVVFAAPQEISAFVRESCDAP